MQTRASSPLWTGLKYATCLLVVKVVFVVGATYRDYFPPRFDEGFLIGRESYFFGAYSAAFYTHFVTGPLSLLLGLILLNRTFRRRFSRWHRRLGRVQGLNVLLFVVPSGIWMSFYAETGLIAGIGFGALAIVTGFTIAMGWRAAIRRDYTQHERWMTRCFILLCSAVMIRLIGGTALTVRYFADWVYPASAWLSWLVPLLTLELVWSIGSRTQRQRSSNLTFVDAGQNRDGTLDPPNRHSRLYS